MHPEEHQLRARSSWSTVLVATVLSAAIAAIYWQVGEFDFLTLDDPAYVNGNRHVRAGLTWPSVVWSFTTCNEGNWIPFTWLSLMLDTAVFGFRPAVYHLMNVLLHVANTLILFAFLARATGNQPRSACVAALFALHPLHVESVAWISERKDLLSTLFGLLSLLAYVGYAKRGGGWRWAACFVCFVASLLSKQTLVTLPFVLLLLDFWPLGRLAERSWRRRIVVEKIPFLVVSAAISAVAVITQNRSNAIKSLGFATLTARCMNAIVVYVAYLRKVLVPFDLGAYYPFPTSTPVWAVAGALLLLLTVSVTTVLWIRKFPFLFVGWAWYLGTLVPMIGIVQVGGQKMADRYTYFPLIGAFLGTVWLICELFPAGALRRWLLPLAAITSLGLLAATSFVQVGYWRDDLTLFRRAVQCGGNSPMATSGLGISLMSSGQTQEGMAMLKLATRMGPSDPQARYNLAVGLQSLGKVDEAAENYRALFAINDKEPEAHNNLGAILMGQHRYQEAKDQFLRSVAINPEQLDALMNLGLLCFETGEYADAIAYSRNALALDPQQSNCRRIIFAALRAQGRLDEANQLMRDPTALPIDFPRISPPVQLTTQYEISHHKRGPLRTSPPVRRPALSLTRT